MKLRDKLRELQALKQEYHEKAPGLTSAEIAEETKKFKALHGQINAMLVDGAKPCPDCGSEPIAMFHDGTPKPFEIGCPKCPAHRVRGTLPEDAVEDWNDAEGGSDGERAPGSFKGYIEAREPGTAVMTHRDATGEVISERKVKARVVKK